jgi:hypothetical protein
MKSQRPNEDKVRKTIEAYMATIPSSAYLAVAIGAMSLSLLFQLAGRGKWGNFIAQWVPTWLTIGMYNNLVKLEGRERRRRAGEHQSQLSRADEVNVTKSI